MENLILSFNVVLPLFLMMILGYLLKKINMFDEVTLKTMNNIAFKVFLPTLLFYNVYKTNLGGVFKPQLMTFAATSIIISFSLLCIIIPIIEKDNLKRGVMVQGIFRSNFVIFGIPVIVSLFGDEYSGITSLLIAVVIPLFNLLAVCSLEIFRGGKINVKNIIRGVITNPLIIASCIGLLFLFIGIKLPNAVEKTVSDVSKIASPLSLILLGGSFRFFSYKKYIKQLIFSVLGKLVVIPGIFIPIAVILGFKGVELACLLIMLSAPTAVSSFTMAEQMDADSELAGQIVVFTSGLSVLTVFLWIFILKQLSLI